MINLKYKRKTVFILFLTAFLYGCALLSFYKIQAEPSIPVFLTDALPSQEQVNSILETGSENTEDFSACFYWDGGMDKIQEPEAGRNAQVTVIGLYGNAALYDPGLNGFSETDRKGCILDEKTARELFGTASAEEQRIFLGTTEYQVRRVLPCKQRILIIRPENPENLCTRVFLPDTGASRSTAVQQFLLAYGLTGTEADSEIPAVCAALSLCLAPAALLIRLITSGLKERQTCSEKEAGYWLWTAALLFAVLAVALFIWKKLEIPRDWIPSRWSDFSFWTEKIKETRERFRLFLLLPKTVIQTENLANCIRTVFRAAAALFFLKLPDVKSKACLRISRS